MTFTRYDLLYALPNGDEQDFLTMKRPSNVSMEAQLMNIHAIRQEISRRPASGITSALVTPKSVNAYFAREVLREIIDLPYPRNRGNGWKLLFWATVVTLVAYRIYRIENAIFSVVHLSPLINYLMLHLSSPAIWSNPAIWTAIPN